MPLPNGEMTPEEYAAARQRAYQKSLSVNGLDRAEEAPNLWANGGELLKSISTGQRDAKGAYIYNTSLNEDGAPQQSYIDRVSGIDYVSHGARGTSYEQAKAWADKTGGQVMYVPAAGGGYYQALMPYHQANQAGIYTRPHDWAPALVAAIMTGGAAAGMAGGGAAAGGAASSGVGAAAGTSAAGGGMALDTAGMAMTGAGGVGSASSAAGAGAAGYGGAAGTVGAVGAAGAAANGASGAASGGGMWDAISSAAGKMSMGDWINAAGTIGGMYSANKAAGAQVDATNRATDMQWKMYEQSRQDQMPWLKNGTEAVNTLAGRLGLNGGSGDLMRSFTADDMKTDPVYQSGLQFGLDEGRKGVNRLASAMGGVQSGATLKALTRFGNDYASTKGNEAFNRFNVNQTNQYNRLASLANVGQQTATQVGGQALQTGQAVGNTMMDAGNARASGYMGMSNALNNGIGQGYNMYMQNQMMNRLYGQQAGYGTTQQPGITGWVSQG